MFNSTSLWSIEGFEYNCAGLLKLLFGSILKAFSFFGFLSWRFSLSSNIWHSYSAVSGICKWILVLKDPSITGDF